MTKNFKPEFRQEVAELVVDKGYSIREAAQAMSMKIPLEKCPVGLDQNIPLHPLLG